MDVAVIAQGVMLPFLGTSLGAAMVFFLRKQVPAKLQKALTGFAAGVMVAASFWGLLQPALEESSGLGSLAFVPAAIGFLVGQTMKAMKGKADPAAVNKMIVSRLEK